MDGQTASSPGSSPARPQRPAWQTALVALAVLLAMSEGAYLLLGAIGKRCLADGAGCGQTTATMSNALFANAAGDGGGQVFTVAFSFGLPGFNNLFYLLFGTIGTGEMGDFLATVAASLLIGFVVLWGHVAAAAGRGIVVTLLLAIGCSLGWFALYNNMEASVFGVSFMELIPLRYLEVPVAAASLFAVSLLAPRSGD